MTLTRSIDRDRRACTFVSFMGQWLRKTMQPLPKYRDGRTGGYPLEQGPCLHDMLATQTNEQKIYYKDN